MKKKIVGIFVCMLMIGTTTVAVADWDPGDGFKMHFPQMPDPIGWDVNFHDWSLGDDWLCTETGPVTDIHFWISWKHDIVGQLPFIKIDIYSNNPGGGYSQPLELLWTRTFTPDQFIIRGPFNGDQGWFDPATMMFLPHDHLQYYQVNIKNIQSAFIQQQGTVYWLVISMPLLYPIEVGWKTTMDKFMDTAVWGYQGMWTPIINPISGPLDFAFVITGKVPVPDLDCDGSLSWTNVPAGSTVSGTFQVGNIGDAGSLLNWQVTSWPDWGTWSFVPSSGVGLAQGSWITVTATCISPKLPCVLQKIQDHQYTGNILVSNSDNSSDNDTVPVTLITPVNKPIVQGGHQNQNHLMFRALTLHLKVKRLLNIL